jgi:hypothetical protein
MSTKGSIAMTAATAVTAKHATAAEGIEDVDAKTVVQVWSEEFNNPLSRTQRVNSNSNPEDPGRSHKRSLSSGSKSTGSCSALISIFVPLSFLCIDFAMVFGRSTFWELNHDDVLARLEAEGLTVLLAVPDVQHEAFTAMALLECSDEDLTDVRSYSLILIPCTLKCSMYTARFEARGSYPDSQVPGETRKAVLSVHLRGIQRAATLCSYI